MTDAMIHNLWMQTFTGKAFYPTDPHARDIDIRDIAHGLSMICRFGGHTSRFYSVAEHCVLMSQVVTPEAALWALLHDAAEAYVGDMVTPLKQQMPEYKAIETKIMSAVCEKVWYYPPREVVQRVKAADLRIVANERAALMRFPPPHPWLTQENVEPLPLTIECWSPDRAEQEWLARYNHLMEGRR